MDPVTIATVLGLIAKGVGVIETLITVGRDAAPAIEVVKNLITGAQSGAVTDDELTATETLLDGMISDFNTPID